MKAISKTMSLCVYCLTPVHFYRTVSLSILFCNPVFCSKFWPLLLRVFFFCVVSSLLPGTGSWTAVAWIISASSLSSFLFDTAHWPDTWHVTGPPRDCRVSDWSPWGQCSKSCGIGEMTRRREVIKHARRGGKVCPPLLETKWCGSARACSRGYFNW